MNRRKRLAPGGAVVAILVAAAGVGFAVWLSSAEDPGRVTASTAVDATLSPGDGAADLGPGDTDGDLYFTIYNPNDYPIEYTSMIAGTVTSSDPTGCPPAHVEISDVTSGLTLASPAATETAQLSIDDVVSMNVDATDTCRDATFDVVLTLTGEQSA